MAVQTETAHAGEFVISEASRTRSRENITIAASQTLNAGAILALSLVGASAAATAASGNTGNGTIGAITIDADAAPGVYVLTIIEPAANGGIFSLEGPDGVALPNGKVAVAYNGKINFTLADGSTDFVAGDSFEIEVVADAAERQYVAWSVDGAPAAGLLFEAVTTGAGETAPAVMIDGDAEVNGNLIAYPDGASLSDKVEARSQLRKLGIKVR